MVERRKWKRYPIAYPIEAREVDDAGELTLKDVSIGGAALTVIGEIERDRKIDLNLFLKRRMFGLKGLIVYTKKLKGGLCHVGVRFMDLPEEFPGVLEREIEEITQFHRESNLYKKQNLSFEKASAKYLKNNPS